MKRIIAPTDFSAIAENACVYAARLAADIDAQLLLFHIMELPVSISGYPVSEELFDEPGVEKKLEALKNKLSTATNNKVKIKTKNVLGLAEHEIKELCNRIKPFAVVMSTDSSDLFRLFFGGSTTVYTAKHLSYPVMVVPHNATYKPLKKIAFASDLKDIYEVPVTEIETIVKLFHAELEIFYAAKNENARDRNGINKVLLNHRLEYLRPQFYFVQSDDVWMGISTLAEKHAVDIFVVISKRHNPFHNSKTKDFIFYSNIPVMVIHENDFAAKASIFSEKENA
jgi:nucleotide-binding universal stress UspA family protein